jgi:protein-S-isoprenylcysteine O-methyltransferase Ste14
MRQPRITLILQLTTAILLIIWGWGFDDLSMFFSNPARTCFVVVALAGAITAALLGLYMHPLRKGSLPVGNQNLQLGILLLLSAFLLWFLPFADRRNILTIKQNPWRYLGLLLCSIGVGVRILALKALGKHFSAYVTLQPHHRLVRDGIYRRIRHPLYLSLLLVPAGIALVFDSYLALPILALAMVFVFDRIRKEERLLTVHFGLEFEDYRRATTWQLIPLFL